MGEITEARIREIVREEIAAIRSVVDDASPTTEQWQGLAIHAASLLERSELLPGVLKLRNDILEYPDQGVDGTIGSTGLVNVGSGVGLGVESSGIVQEAAGLSDPVVSHSSSPVESRPEAATSDVPMTTVQGSADTTFSGVGVAGASAAPADSSKEKPGAGAPGADQN